MKKFTFSLLAASLLILGACSESTDETTSAVAPATSAPQPSPVVKEEAQSSTVEEIKEKAAEKVEEVKAVATEKVEEAKEVAAEKMEEVKESAADKLNALKDKY